MERKLVLELSNDRGLESQISETETLTSQPSAISDMMSEDQAEILFIILWEVLQKRGHHYCFKIIAKRKTAALHWQVGGPAQGSKVYPQTLCVSPVSLL